MKIKLLSCFTALFFLFALTNFVQADETCSDKKLVVLGDSLVAGYGLGPGEAFPEQLGKALEGEGINLKIINAGVSGDTSTGGLARLDWSIGEDASAVIVELGANDALRGITPEATRKNIEQIIIKLKAKDIKVLLAGMMAPPNMGPAYGKAFNRIYQELAHAHDILLYPFFLDGVAAQPKLNQADGIHPTKEGVSEIVKRFMPAAKKLISQICISD